MGVKNATLHFDGGIRGKQIAVGYYASNPNNSKHILVRAGKVLGEGTSNEAEYQALIHGLRACLKKGVKIIRIIGDSQLIVFQVKGKYAVKKENLKRLHDEAKELLSRFDEWFIEWVPRERNKIADKLVNEAFKERGL